jgi:HEAT repeat protein
LSPVERQVEAALVVAVGLAEPRLLTPALCLCRDPSPRVRALAATLLGALGGSAGVEDLTALLTDPTPAVRAAAARALGRLGHWPAAPALAPLLRDRVWAVRREAALALHVLGAPGLLFLRRYLADADRFAADMARQVLDLPEATELMVAL